MIKHANCYATIDSTCRVELSFWQSSIGENARERVQQSILACMPEADRPMSISQSLEAFDRLGQSKVLVFAGLALQKQYHNTHAYVKSIKVGNCPGIAKAGDSPFIAQVAERLGNFLVMANTAAATSSGPTEMLRGAAAAQRMFEVVKDAMHQDPPNPSLETVFTLLCFSFLLPPHDSNELRKINTQLASKRVGDATKGPKRSIKKGMSLAESKEHVASLFAR